MRKFNKCYLFVCTLFFALSLLNAQMLHAQKVVSGFVKDKNKAPLKGVSVIVKGRSNGTVTNDSGRYVITVPEGENTLVFSAAGFKNVEASVKSLSEEIILTDDYAKLDEVVVVGYGTQKRREVTGAVATIKAENFTNGAIRDVSEAIRGKVAGLNVTSGSGNPSATSNVSLRGYASLAGSTAPLILINGIPGGFNTVAPEDIASIDVLKDASAAAIYGSRGANGVILITTKAAGNETPTSLIYSGYGSVSEFAKKAKFLTADKMRELKKDGVNVGMTDKGLNTDWLGLITRTGSMHNHNVSMKGGNRRSSYVANVNYNNQNGVFKNTYNQELKATLDFYHYMFDDRLKINLNLIKGFQKQDVANNLFGSMDIDNPYRQANIHNPTDSVTNYRGKWYETNTPIQYYNPVAIINETLGETENEWTRLSGNIGVNVLKGWDVNLLLSTNRNNGNSGSYETWNHYSTSLQGKNGVANLSTSRSRTDNLELTSTYRKNWKGHNFTFLGGYSYQYNVNDGFSAYNFDFQHDVLSYHDIYWGKALPDGRGASMGSYKNDNKLIAFLGRINYSYDGRYTVMASIRREGSSKFGANHKWGNFPSVSTGWTISNESFFKNVSAVNLLKLRAGWGITGIAPASSYLSLATYEYGTIFKNGDESIYPLKPGQNPNPNLRWEKSTEFNFGLDFAVLNNRLSGSIDVYNKETKDLLWNYPVPSPPNFSTVTVANVGRMRNKGIEVLLNAVPVKSRNFSWNSSLTFSHNANKLLSLSNDFYQIDQNRLEFGGITEPISILSHRLEVGMPLGNFYGFKSVDITDNGLWIIETAKGERKTLAADMLGQDQYRQYLGNGIPKYTGGFTNTFNYKGWDMSVVLTGAFGYQILNSQRMFYENPNIPFNVLESAYDKVYGKAVLKYPQTYVSYYLENGNYLKLDNITIGYSPKLQAGKYFKSLRVYASGANLAYITGYKGLDPEIIRNDVRIAGIDDRDKYPSIRTFTIGVNATF